MADEIGQLISSDAINKLIDQIKINDLYYTTGTWATVNNKVTFTATPKTGKNQNDNDHKLTFTFPVGYGSIQNPYNAITANYVLAGPSSGSNTAVPIFRELTAADIPISTTSSWTNGTTAGPVLSTTVNNSITTSTIPVATTEQSGVVNTTTQKFEGIKSFKHGSSIYTSSTATSPRLYFKQADGENIGNIGIVTAKTNDVQRTHAVEFIQYSYDDSGNIQTIGENYRLPIVNANMTASQMYTILTTKSAVTIGQGGTGATSASGARENLGITDIATISLPTDNTATVFLRGDKSWQKPYKTLSTTSVKLEFSGTSEVTVSSCTGVTTSNTVIISPLSNDSTSATLDNENLSSWEIWRDAGIRCISQGTASLTFKADDATTATTYFNAIILD